MWVVKIGGSLNNDPVLPQWLELLAQLGGGLAFGKRERAREGRLFAGAESIGYLLEGKAHRLLTLAMYCVYSIQYSTTRAQQRDRFCHEHVNQAP